MLGAPPIALFLMKLIFLDTETTGIDDDARLVQLSYSVYGTDTRLDALYTPPVPISIGAMATHHITPRMLVGRPSFAESGDREVLQQLLAGHVLVAHHAPYDIHILRNEGVDTPHWIDTCRVAHHLFPDLESHGLQYLRYYFEMDIEARAHDATGDILVLEHVFHRLADELRRQQPALQGDDRALVQRMAQMSQEPVLLRLMKYGKYKGKPVADVVVSDRSYAEWMLGAERQKEGHNRNDNLIYTLGKMLGR